MDQMYVTMESISCQNANASTRIFLVNEDVPLGQFIDMLGLNSRFYCILVDGLVINDDSSYLLKKGSEVQLLSRI